MEGFCPLYRKHRTAFVAYCALVLLYVGPMTGVMFRIPGQLARCSSEPDPRNSSRHAGRKPQVVVPNLGAIPPEVHEAPRAPIATHRDEIGPATPTAPVRNYHELVFPLIRYPWEQLDYEVVFLGPRPGYRAMTISDRRRIEIYARREEDPKALAYDLAHEIGHAFDLECNDYERRNQWRKLRGITVETPWFGCDRCSDYETPAGDFAETFAFLLLGPGNYHSRLARAPAPGQMADLAAFCRINPEDLYDPHPQPLYVQAKQTAGVMPEWRRPIASK